MDHAGDTGRVKRNTPKHFLLSFFAERSRRRHVHGERKPRIYWAGPREARGTHTHSNDHGPAQHNDVARLGADQEGASPLRFHRRQRATGAPYHTTTFLENLQTEDFERRIRPLSHYISTSPWDFLSI